MAWWNMQNPRLSSGTSPSLQQAWLSDPRQRWKILQCHDWHARQKGKKEKKNNFSKPRNSKANNFQSPVSWGLPTHSTRNQPSQPSWAKIPVRQEFAPSQNQWFKSSHTTNPCWCMNSNNQTLNCLLGNGLAAWSAPPPVGGSPLWENNQLIQRVRQALGIVNMMPFI